MRPAKLLSIALMLIGIFILGKATAQIKIGTNGANIQPSSLLELESANQGLLLPRVADTVAINALAPPNGMLIYLTKAPAVGLYVRKVSGWEYLTGSLGGNGNFNSLTVAGMITAGGFSGPLNGNATSANTAINATNSANSTILNDLSTPQPTYLTFVTATNGNSQLRTAASKLSFVPNTGILTATGFAGPLTGDVTGNATSATNATNASNTDILPEQASPAIHYPTFVSGTTGNLPHLANTGLNYVPSTGTLTATRFSGPLTGNATSATNALTTTITNDNATGTVTYPTFVTASSGNMGQSTADASLRFIPSTGNLTSTSFTSTIANGTSPFVVTSSTPVENLTATNSRFSEINEDGANTATVYPTFVTGNTGYQNHRTASTRLRFVPSTGTLTATTFTGSLNGNAATATSATDATNSVNSNITDDNLNVADAYPVFVNSAPGNQPLQVGTNNLRYQPSTGRLSAGRFVGPLTGNVTGTADNATEALNTVNIRVNPSNVSTPVYPTFVSATASLPTAGLPPFASNNLSFVPQTGELTATTFRGGLIGNASTATNISGGVVAAINGGTGQNLYSPGDLLYAGTSTALDRLAVGAPGTILRVVGGVPTWSTAGGGTVTNVTGVPNRITVIDPTVAPVITIASTYGGQTSIDTVGTVGVGTWQADIVGASYGGTGRNGFAANEILVGAGTGAPLASIPLAGTAGRVLTSQGPGSLPTFETPGIGDMVLAVDQEVTAPKRFTDGNLSILGTGTGETTLRADANSVGVATFPAGSYTLVGTTGTQTISGKTFSPGTIFQGTTTLDVINNTSQVTTGNITAGSFTGPLTGNVTGNASTATNFNGALAGDVTGNQTTTVVARVGGETAADIASGVIRANTATAVASNNTIVARDLNGDFSADQITATLVGNASTATTLQIPRTIYGNAFDGSADVSGIIDGSFGGTGVANTGKTITIGGGSFSTSGTGTLELNTDAATNVTLPTSGTLFGSAVNSIPSATIAGALANETGSGDPVFSTSPVLTTPRANSLIGNSVTPAILPGAGVTNELITGTNLAGTIIFTSAGTTPSGDPLVTISFAGVVFPTGSYPVLFPANAAAAALVPSQQVFAVGGTTNFIVMAGTDAPDGPVEYRWNYQVIGN